MFPVMRESFFKRSSLDEKNSHEATFALGVQCKRFLSSLTFWLFYMRTCRLPDLFRLELRQQCLHKSEQYTCLIHHTALSLLQNYGQVRVFKIRRQFLSSSPG